MWINAQRDGRTSECRWRPVFNAANWLTPTTRVPCSNAAKTRNRLKFAGVPQTRQQISADSGPKFTMHAATARCTPRTGCCCVVPCRRGCNSVMITAAFFHG